MHSRKRSIAFISDENPTNADTLTLNANDHDNNGLNSEQDTPSKRLQHNSGFALLTNRPKLRYNVHRLLNNLAFTRLYITSNFQAWDPASSPVLLCCVEEQQNEVYAAVCPILPSLYTISPTLQALAVTAGYISPNAMSDQALSRILPLTTTAGLEGSVAEEFETFRRALGPGDCVALISPSGECIWTSHEAKSAQDLQTGLAQALLKATHSGGGDGGGRGDVPMSNGG